MKKLFSGLKSLINKLRPVKDGIIYNKHGYTTYRNGLKDGVEISRKNGYLKCHYKNGFLNGQYIFEGVDKMQVKRCNYKMGLLDGYSISTNNVEDTQCYGYFKNGLREGVWHYFDKRTVHEVNFRNSITVELLKEFSIKREEYINFNHLFGMEWRTELILERNYYYL